MIRISGPKHYSDCQASNWNDAADRSFRLLHALANTVAPSRRVGPTSERLWSLLALRSSQWGHEANAVDNDSRPKTVVLILWVLVMMMQEDELATTWKCESAKAALHHVT